MGGIVFTLILLVVFSYFFILSFGITDFREVDPVGAAGFPQFILALLVLLLVISLFNTIKQYMKNKGQDSDKTPKSVLVIFLGLIISIALFIILLQVIGFLCASLLLTLGMLLILGERKKIRIALLTLFVPTGFTVLFGVLLSIPLPRGTGIFMAISRLFY
ncbi:MAG TPA: tripartite tricarboxylate transporter TctB family protein [Candidatus Avamphibacillus sp.]|nr:tripartite tricarboxylate transporter TctB family protein [Candidatus Avamphibacillus sp.]